MTVLDMSDPDIRLRVTLVTVAHGLDVEINTGMQLTRGGSALKTAKRLGFTGRTKLEALKWTVEKLEEIDPDWVAGTHISNTIGR